MTLGLHELHELFCSLSGLGVSNDHAYSGVRIAAVQIGPHPFEGFSEFLAFDDKGEVESFKFGGVFEVAEEVD